MSWAQWPQTGVPQPPPTPAPAISAPGQVSSVAPPAPVNPSAGASYSPAIPPPTSYTPTQFAALPTDQQYAIQQNWQQWQTYHQQYAQWHAQYGEQYQREMQAKLGMVAPSLPFVPPMPPYAAPVPPSNPCTTYSVPPPPPTQASNISNTPNIAAAATQPPPPPPPPEDNTADQNKSFGNQMSLENKPNAEVANLIGPQMIRDPPGQIEMQQQQDRFQQQGQQNRSQFGQHFQQNRGQFDQQNRGQYDQQNRGQFDQQSQQNLGQFDQQSQQNRGQFDQQNRGQFDQQSQQSRGQFDQQNRGQFDQQNRGQFDQQSQPNRDPYEKQSQQNQGQFEQQPPQNRGQFDQHFQQNRPPFDQQYQKNRPPFEQQSQQSPQWKSNNDSRNFNDRRSFGGNDRDRNRNNYGDNFGNRNSRDWNRNDNDSMGRNSWQQQQSFRDQNQPNQQMQQQQPFRDSPQNQQQSFRDTQPIQQQSFRDNVPNPQMQMQSTQSGQQQMQMEPTKSDQPPMQMQSTQPGQQQSPLPKTDNQIPNEDIGEDGDEKTPEEKAFDEQFRKWEEQFENWKKQNANHPDRKAYQEYEMKFEDCRRKLLERREVMRKRKLERKLKEEKERQMREIERNPPPPVNILEPPNVQPPIINEPPVENIVAVKEPEEKKEVEMQKDDDVLIVEAEPKKVQNEPIAERTEPEQHEFLKATKSDGIPGLDLVSETEENVKNKKVDEDVTEVIDLEAESKLDRSGEKTGPIPEKLGEIKKPMKENVQMNVNELNQSPFQMDQGEGMPMKKEIPSLLSQKFDMPLMSPPHGQEIIKENLGGEINQQETAPNTFNQQPNSKETFGSFLEKNAPVGLVTPPVNDAVIKNQSIPPEGVPGDKGNVPTGIAELANVLSDPNVLALITAALGTNAAPALLNNMNATGDNQGGQPKVSPWATGQAPFQDQNQTMQNQFRGQQMGGNFRDSQGGNNLRDSFGGNFRGFQSPGGNFRDSQGGNFGVSPGGDFRDSPRDGFRDMQGGGGFRDNFRDSFDGSFRDSLGGKFRDSPGGNFRDSPGGNFRDSPGGNLRDSLGRNFRDLQGGNFRDLQGGNFGNQNRGDFGNQNNMSPWQDSNQNSAWANRNMGENQWQNRSNRQQNFRRGGNQGFGGRNMGEKKNAPWQEDDVDMRSSERNNSADERSKSSERGEKVNPFKDHDDRGGGRVNPFSDAGRGRRNQQENRDRSRSGNRNSRGRSRSSGRSGGQGDNLSQGFNRNPFKNEPNVFDKPLDSPNVDRNTSVTSGGGDAGNVDNPDKEEFFRPAHVIDYQNKPLGGGDSGQNDVLMPCKVVDYGHKPSGNNNDQGETNDFFPMKTIDYGHASAAKPESESDNANANFEGRKNDFTGKNRNRNRSRYNKKTGGLPESNPYFPGLWSFINKQSQQRPGLPTQHGERKKSPLNEQNDQQIGFENDTDFVLESPTTNENRKNFDEISDDDNDFDETDFRYPDHEELNAVNSPVFEETKPSPIFPIKESTFSTKVEQKIQLIFPTMENNNTITIDEILLKPGRLSRPKKIVIILRGPPGSGKSYVAKLIKEKEVEMGGSIPRLLSIDDYFMTEIDKEGKCPNTGRKVVVNEIIYEYEKEMEEKYMQYLIKAFKKAINDRLFDFIIVDCVNHSLRTFTEFYNNAKSANFAPYTIDLLCDIETCLNRNIHNRSEEDIQHILDSWVSTPDHYIKLDVTSLIQNAVIRHVEMEDISDVEDSSDDTDTEQYNMKEVIKCMTKSKWDTDAAEESLARLDGTSKPLQRNVTLEDYMQMDGWEPSPSTSGKKKRVRWADIEEKKEQEKMRAIGFVVGQTDWKRMMDPSGGTSALTKTKYIEKIGRRKK